MEKLLNFFKLRFIEFLGLIVLAAGLIIIYSIATYSPSNPTIIFPDTADTRFVLIKYGANVADFILQAFGILAVGLGLNCFAFGGKIIINKQVEYISLRLLFIVLYLIFGSFFFKIYSDQSFWLPDNGNGGFLGAYLVQLFSSVDKQLLKTISYVSCGLSLTFFFLSLGVSLQNWKNIFFPFVIGLAFGFGWTPCIGPILGSILALAAMEETLLKAITLLGFYSLGLSIPFVLSGYLIQTFLVFSKNIKKNINLISKVGGCILLITGILILTNQLQTLGFYILNTFPVLQQFG